VAESGSGEAGPRVEGPEGGEACFGRTGAVTRITKRGQHRVLTGLPLLAEEGGVAASGPVDLGFSGRTGYLLVGNPGGGSKTREQFGPAGRRFGKLLKVNLHGIRAVADFPRFEENNNPDEGGGALPGEEIDSNPNGLLVRHRSELVTDAGGNNLLKADTRAASAWSRCSRPGTSRLRRGSPTCRPRSRCRPCRPRSSRARTAPTTSAS
jgi:hypothetical protein